MQFDCDTAMNKKYICDCGATGCPTMCGDIYVLELPRYEEPELSKIKEEPYWIKLNKKKKKPA